MYQKYISKFDKLYDCHSCGDNRFFISTSVLYAAYQQHLPFVVLILINVSSYRMAVRERHTSSAKHGREKQKKFNSVHCLQQSDRYWWGAPQVSTCHGKQKEKTSESVGMCPFVSNWNLQRLMSACCSFFIRTEICCMTTNHKHVGRGLLWCLRGELLKVSR